MEQLEALRLTYSLLSIRGYSNWIVVVTDETSRAGYCDYEKRTIGLSAAHLAAHSDEGVRDIILHEVAHVIAGQDAAHGRRWLDTSMALGGSGRTNWSNQTVVRPELLFKWEYVCPTCDCVLIRSVTAISQDLITRVHCGSRVVQARKYQALTSV